MRNMAAVIIKRTTDYAGAVKAMVAENDWLQLANYQFRSMI